MRLLLLVLLLTSSAVAQVHPNSLIVNVTTSQKQDVKVRARSARGPSDKTTISTRILSVDCRLLGAPRDEKITFRWFFVKKNEVEGKLENHASGVEEVAVPAASVGKTFTIESPPLSVREFVRYQGLDRTDVITGDTHAGWVLWAVQNGTILRTYASDPAMGDWLQRNLPPPPKRAKA